MLSSWLFGLVVSNSLQSPGSCGSSKIPRDFWGKNTGVGRHFLLQGDLPHPGIEAASLNSHVLAGGFFTPSITKIFVNEVKLKPCLGYKSLHQLSVLIDLKFIANIFLFWYLFIFNWLVYNIGFISVIYQHELTKNVHMSPPSISTSKN